MSVTYGFYNSLDGDRVYDAEQFSSFLDGIVYDGVYGAYGNKFYVTADGSSLTLTVDTGRAWFDHTWTLNDTLLYIEASEADILLPRIDAIVLEINKESRENIIKFVQGTAAANPLKPVMTKTQTIKEYAIAYISRPANSTVIVQSNIEYVVGNAETPLCSALSLAGVPSGGKIGQVLAKSSSESGAVNWYDWDKLPFDKWYLCDGINENNVLAAYKFINRGTEASALKNVNEKTTYILTKNDDSVTWTNDQGFYIPGRCGLDNADLRATEMITVIIKYSNADLSKAVVLTGGFGENKTSGLFASTPYAINSYNYRNTGNAGYLARRVADETHSQTSQTAAQQGVLAVSYKFSDNTGSLYLNGQLLSTSKPSNVTGDYGSYAFPQSKVIGTSKATTSDAVMHADHWAHGAFRVQYALFLNCELSAQQHSDIYRNIVSDAG